MNNAFHRELQGLFSDGVRLTVVFSSIELRDVYVIITPQSHAAEQVLSDDTDRD